MNVIGVTNERSTWLEEMTMLRDAAQQRAPSC